MAIPDYLVPILDSVDRGGYKDNRKFVPYDSLNLTNTKILQMLLIFIAKTDRFAANEK